MSIWMFLKVTADLFLYASVIGGFPSLFTGSIDLFWPAVLCGGGVCAACLIADQGLWNLRWLGMLPALGCFALAGELMDGLVLVPMALYCAAVIGMGQFSLDYYNFRAAFVRTLKLWCLYWSVIVLLHAFEVESNAKHILLNSAVPTRYGLLWALCNVVLQRRLRLGIENHRLTRRQTALVCVGGGAVTVGLMGLERLLHQYSTSVSQLLGRLLRALVAFPIGLIGAVVEWIMGLDPETLDRLEEELTAPTTEPPDSGNLPMGTPVEPEPQPVIEPGFPWWLAVLILVAMTAVLFGMLHILRRGKVRPGTQRQIQRIAPPVREKREPVRGNRSRVRRAYRAQLRALRKRGQRIRPSDTSLDVLAGLPAAANAHAAQALRQVYLRARYDPNHSVTNEDVRTAQDAAKEI